MTKEKNRIHPELLKVYNSPLYRKRIKRMVASIKSLRGIHWGTKLPGNINPIKKDAPEKERDRHAKISATWADRSTAHYWTQTIEAPYERRIAASTRTEQE